MGIEKRFKILQDELRSLLLLSNLLKNKLQQLNASVARLPESMALQQLRSECRVLVKAADISFNLNSIPTSSNSVSIAILFN